MKTYDNEEYEGSGVGLSICKRIMERHGGDIHIESELEKGTTVTLLWRKN